MVGEKGGRQHRPIGEGHDTTHPNEEENNTQKEEEESSMNGNCSNHLTTFPSGGVEIPPHTRGWRCFLRRLISGGSAFFPSSCGRCCLLPHLGADAFAASFGWCPSSPHPTLAPSLFGWWCVPPPLGGCACHPRKRQNLEFNSTT